MEINAGDQARGGSSLSNILLTAEQDGQRCAGPVLLAGLAIGVGVTQLSTQVLRESSDLSMDLLSLLVLELVGPILVSVLGMTLLLPRWLDRVATFGYRAWRRSVPSAALVGCFLMLMFFSGSLLAGILITPRGEMATELFDLISELRIIDVMRSLVRCAGFLAVLCGWCQWRAENCLRRSQSQTTILSNLLVEGLMIGLALKLVWFLIAHSLMFTETMA